MMQPSARAWLQLGQIRPEPDQKTLRRTAG